MVWVHGGGYTIGTLADAGSTAADALARRGDLVFVSINYRLGALGFLDLTAHAHARPARRQQPGPA